MLPVRLIARPVYCHLQRQVPQRLILQNGPRLTRFRQLPAHIQSFKYTTKMDAEGDWDNMISFWFDRNPQDWFFPPEGLDSEIRTRYQDLISQARSGALDSWAKQPKGALCLVLLLDQFPRNIFRGSGESFSSDHKALEVVTDAIAKQFDKEIGKTSRMQQQLFYLPLMHAENLLAQIACVALYENLLKLSQERSEDHEFWSNGVEFSRRHLNCIAQLGRFPKRNEALGRPNTEEEKQFLKENPAGF